MTLHHITPDHTGNEWWDRLSALFLRLGATNEGSEVLRSYVPTGFYPVSGEGTPLSLTEFENRLKDMLTTEQKRRESRKHQAAAERLQRDNAEFETAFARPDADEEVRSGEWQGFTHGEAAAWCWNLFQYEPKGFVTPGIYVREKALTELRAGGLPEVFGYPKRARTLTENGVDAREYRELRQTLQSPTFDYEDVTYSSRLAY